MEEEEDKGIIKWPYYIIGYALSVILVLITSFIIFIYIKTKKLHSYPCYFNIILCLVIALDNVIRLIPLKDASPNDIICKIQGYTLAFFDKLMVSMMTVYSIISFLGLVKNTCYKFHEKTIFVGLISLSIIFSLAFSLIFIKNTTAKYDDICYIEGNKEKPDNLRKKMK